MNLGITNALSNLGVPLEVVIVMVLFLATAITTAVDFKRGLIFQIIVWAGVFIWFYKAEYNFAYPVILMMIDLVILSFTLYSVSKQTQRGTLI